MVGSLYFVQNFDITGKPGAGFYLFENRAASILLPKHRLADELHILPFIITTVGDPDGAGPRSASIPGAVQVGRRTKKRHQRQATKVVGVKEDTSSHNKAARVPEPLVSV